MSAALRRTVRARADDRCEYCGLEQRACLLSFHVEHIIPRQHGGATIEDNLALACPHCNLHKGPNLTGLDLETGAISRLFHPRRDLWAEHFSLRMTRIEGLTIIGRTTILVLDLNSREQLRLRALVPKRR